MVLADMVSRLRFKIGDTDSTKFQDNTDLEQVIKEAMNEHNKDYTLDTVPENEEYLILKLAQISCYYTLASREAKNYKINVDGISIAKAERVKNYMSLAQALEKEYREIINSPDYAEIEVGNMKRYSVEVNKLVGGDTYEQ